MYTRTCLIRRGRWISAWARLGRADRLRQSAAEFSGHSRLSRSERLVHASKPRTLRSLSKISKSTDQVNRCNLFERIGAYSGVDVYALGAPVSQKVGDIDEGQAVSEKTGCASVAERLRAGVLRRNAQFSHAAPYDVGHGMSYQLSKGRLQCHENLGAGRARSRVLNVATEGCCKGFAQGELLKTSSLCSANRKAIPYPVDVGQQKIRSFASSQSIHGEEQQERFGTEVAWVRAYRRFEQSVNVLPNRP